MNRVHSHRTIEGSKVVAYKVQPNYLGSTSFTLFQNEASAYKKQGIERVSSARHLPQVILLSTYLQ